jgi:hypothetical protein
MGDEVSRVEDFGFYACPLLESIDLGRVLSIGEQAFAHSGLGNASLAGTIGTMAFDDSGSLTFVEFRGNVTIAGEGAFQHCLALVRLRVTGWTAGHIDGFDTVHNVSLATWDCGIEHSDQLHALDWVVIEGCEPVGDVFCQRWHGVRVPAPVGLAVPPCLAGNVTEDPSRQCAVTEPTATPAVAVRPGKSLEIGLIAVVCAVIVAFLCRRATALRVGYESVTTTWRPH